MKVINICNKVIEYSFYALFFFVPLVLAPDTSELFEFNKMWLTYILSLVILAAWTSKMIAKRHFKIQRTPLDIPILLFFASQVISTIFTLDRHISLWGYYSRFNGGLFSTITYIFLYYAFVSNFRENAKSIVKRLIAVTISSAVIVALWGLPSHFGYDPTCLVFRGTFDVSCWTSDFQPRVRIFSTLGQPDWLAAYLATLIPVVAALLIKSKLFKELKGGIKLSVKDAGFALLYFLIFVLFYLDLLYSNAKSGLLGIWTGAFFFAAFYLFIKFKEKEEKIKGFTLDFKLLTLAVISVLVMTFIVATPFNFLRNYFTFQGITGNISLLVNKPKATPVPKTSKTVTPAPVAAAGELGGTDSGKIRLLVWRGALDAWLHNPIFGTGVETFAFAYYQYRPAAHNLTSEWRYLYNKAHNEYLNYLATTGAVGLLTYLSIIGVFLYFTLKTLLKNKINDENRKTLVLGLTSGYVTILVTNFFGFSVVIINLFIFLIPALVFTLLNLINYDKNISFALNKKVDGSKPKTEEEYRITAPIWAGIAVIIIVCGFLAFSLINDWNADKAYARGYNLDRAGDYQSAYPLLHQAVEQRPSEPVFKDELAVNDAVLTIAVLRQAQSQPSQASQSAALAQKLAEEAVKTSDEVTSQHPNNVVFWKDRVRIFYTLAQADQRYFPLALDATKKSAELAPTDADISYNLGILYGQTGDTKSAVSTLENTVKLKPDFLNAFYALGIFYHQLAINNKGQVVNQSYQEKAVNAINQMLKLSPGNQQALDALKTWNAGK